MSEFDKLDRAIVDLLIQDGRMSYAEIARRVGSSERSIRYRLDRLIGAGVIRISAIVNPKAVGYPVMADVWMEIEPGRVQEVAHRIAQFEQVSYVACSTGDRDLSIQVQARDNAELYQFVSQVLGNVPGVRKTSTILVPLVLKDVYDWNIPRGDKPGRKEGST